MILFSLIIEYCVKISIYSMHKIIFYYEPLKYEVSV